MGKARAYKALTRRAAARRDGAPPKLLTFRGWTTSDLGRKFVASTTLGPAEDGTTIVPGCLTCESEERETWTAESLRAAFRRRSNSPRESGRTRLRRSTFQVNTLVVKRQARARCESRARLSAHEQEWDLVKRCDQPGKSSLQT